MAATDVIKVGSQPPVGRRVVDLTLLFGTHATIIEGDIDFYGTVLDIWFVVPALDGTQCTLSFDDEDNTEIYTSGLLDESLTHHLIPGISYAGVLTVKVTAATTQLANRVFKVKIIYA